MFKNGQRVVYTCPENRKFPQVSKYADMGLDERVMHLNVRDERGRILPITGTVLRTDVEVTGAAMVAFLPDGWETPPDGGTVGFMAPEEQFQALTDDGIRLPGTITDRLGRRLT